MIKAKKVEMGVGVHIGKNVEIDVLETFHIGDRSRIGNNARISGRSVTIGDDFYSSDWDFGGLEIGRGRKNWPDATIRIGDRCTFHNNRIDLSRAVTIGDDVGLSPDVTIYGHGYWLSVLDGFPVTYGEVRIGSGAIIGYRSLILPGASVGEKAVIGAQSVVSGKLKGNAVYAGSPAKLVRDVRQPSEKQRRDMLDGLLELYHQFCNHRNVSVSVVVDYPFVFVDECVFNVLTLKFDGHETQTTDDFRDFVFRYGLRFYSKRPFRAL